MVPFEKTIQFKSRIVIHHSKSVNDIKACLKKVQNTIGLNSRRSQKTDLVKKDFSSSLNEEKSQSDAEAKVIHGVRNNELNFYAPSQGSSENLQPKNSETDLHNDSEEIIFQQQQKRGNS